MIYYIIFFIANYLDWITTRIGLSLGNTLYGDFFGEANPYSVMNLNSPLADILKFGLAIIFMLAYMYLEKTYSDYKPIRYAIRISLIVCSISFFIAVIHNVNQIVYMVRNG